MRKTQKELEVKKLLLGLVLLTSINCFAEKQNISIYVTTNNMTMSGNYQLFNSIEISLRNALVNYGCHISTLKHNLPPNKGVIQFGFQNITASYTGLADCDDYAAPIFTGTVEIINGPVENASLVLNAVLNGKIITTKH